MLPFKVSFWVIEHVCVCACVWVLNACNAILFINSESWTFVINTDHFTIFRTPFYEPLIDALCVWIGSVKSVGEDQKYL